MPQQDQGGGIQGFLQQMMGLIQLSQAQRELAIRDRAGQAGLIASYLDTARQTTDPTALVNLRKTYTQIDPRLKDQMLVELAGKTTSRQDVFQTGQAQQGQALMSPEQRGATQQAAYSQEVAGALPGQVAVSGAQVGLAPQLAGLPIAQQVLQNKQFNEQMRQFNQQYGMEQQRLDISQRQFAQGQTLDWAKLNTERDIANGEQALRMAGLQIDKEAAAAKGQEAQLDLFHKQLSDLAKEKAGLSPMEIEMRTREINSQLNRLYDERLIIAPTGPNGQPYKKFLTPDEIQIPGFMGAMRGFGSAVGQGITGALSQPGGVGFQPNVQDWWHQ